MLKALQLPIVSAKQIIKTRKAATRYIVPDLIDFFGDERKEIRTHIEKINVYICVKCRTV